MVGPRIAPPGRSGEGLALPADVCHASRIPSLGHAEAAALATVELDQLLALLDDLSSADWAKPTVCDLWDVREMVAHVAGAAASFAQLSEFSRQWNPRVQRPYRATGYSFLDTVNQIQVDDRARAGPSELIAELRAAGPRAIATRRRLPAVLRATRMPMPVLGFVPIGYLTDLIYTRDMWIHRLDIARATGRQMMLSPEHDGRLLALMMRDLAPRLAPVLRGQPVVIDLAGSAGGAFWLGASAKPVVHLGLDSLDFVWLAAGRVRPDDIRVQVESTANPPLAERVLAAISVPV